MTITELYNGIFSLITGAITAICTKIILSRMAAIEERMDLFRTKEDCLDRSAKIDRDCCQRHDRVRKDLETSNETNSDIMRSNSKSISELKDKLIRHEAYELGVKNGHG